MDARTTPSSQQLNAARPPVTRIEKRTNNGRVMVIFMENNA